MYIGIESRMRLKNGGGFNEFVARQAKAPDPGGAPGLVYCHGGAQVDQAVLGKPGVRNHIQQPALPFVVNRRHTLQACQAVVAEVQQAHAAGFFGDEQAATGQKSHAPGELEFIRESPNLEILPGALCRHSTCIDGEAFFHRHVGFQRAVLQRVASAEQADGEQQRENSGHSVTSVNPDETGTSIAFPARSGKRRRGRVRRCRQGGGHWPGRLSTLFENSPRTLLTIIRIGTNLRTILRKSGGSEPCTSVCVNALPMPRSALQCTQAQVRSPKFAIRWVPPASAANAVISRARSCARRWPTTWMTSHCSTRPPERPPGRFFSRFPSSIARSDG